MSHCYLSSKSKNNMKKRYFEYFIADYFPTLNKKDPVEANKTYKNRRKDKLNRISFLSAFRPSFIISPLSLFLASTWTFFSESLA